MQIPKSKVYKILVFSDWDSVRIKSGWGGVWGGLTVAINCEGEVKSKGSLIMIDMDRVPINTPNLISLYGMYQK